MKYDSNCWTEECRHTIYVKNSYIANSIDIDLLTYFHHKIDWDRISHGSGLSYNSIYKFKGAINWRIFIDQNLDFPPYSLGLIEDIVYEDVGRFDDIWDLLSLCGTTIRFMLRFHHKMDYYVIDYTDSFTGYTWDEGAWLPFPPTGERKRRWVVGKRGWDRIG